MDQRQVKAFVIAATNRLAPDNGRWKVPSQTGTGSYTVLVTRDGSWNCSCPDFEERLQPCKHVLAVEVTISRETDGKGVTYSESVKITYSQDWPAYNRAQCDEKRMFLALLGELCQLVPQPPQTGRGRPRLPLSDMTFATVYKCYESISARRFTSDLNAAQAAGLIEHAAQFNTTLAYFRNPVMAETLSGLIEISSLPLRAIETQFAIDSSGFGTRTMKTWFSQKHGREMREREWRKCHLMCGTSTHIVTAAQVSAPYANDTTFLPELLSTTVSNFPAVEEVSADKGYLSRSNVEMIEKQGAVPFIPFKSNSINRKAEGDTPWDRMYHLFAYRREEFLTHYHRRSNVETVFAMMKAKFGETLFSRTPEAQTTEVLGKVVAHNLCCLIQAFYELGVEPTFDGMSAPARKMLASAS
jgi:transposase